MSSHWLVHLSDIHLGATPDQETAILAPLQRALAEARAQRDRPPALIAITGDLYDSADVDVGPATDRFVRWLDGVRKALDGDVPTIAMPGNHDRRTQGLLLPFRTSLLTALAEARVPGLRVGGRELPFLAELVPDAFHGLPFAVATIDSSYTPTGLISAGGLLREEDLLELAEELRQQLGHDARRPLLLLTHHHLVPTPVTDTARIDADTTNPVLRWLARNLLPRTISYADHEEWMMTALGAGSALTTLQAFGRPVLVLHGHKHYPTVRALRASLEEQGDVVLLSAGSAGLALPLDDGDEDDVARLWPSFHVLDVDDREQSVRVHTRAYYRSSPPAERELLHVRASGRHWEVRPVDDRVRHGSTRLVVNRFDATLRECAGREDARWDLLGVRTVKADAPLEYTERLRAAAGAVFEHALGSLPASTRSIHLPTDGTPYAYRLIGGAVRTVTEAMRVYGAVDPYEGVELLSRYESAEARLTLRGLPARAKPFGSVVDLTRGRAMPHPIARRDDGAHELVVHDCAPRMQLRIQWRPE